MPEFDLVFDKLREALETETMTASYVPLSTDADTEEMDGIEELRRIVEELEEPEPTTFAST